MTATKSLLLSLKSAARISSTALLALAALLQPFVRALPAQTTGQQAPSAAAKKTPEMPALYPIRVDGKFGYMDRAGKIVVAPQFQRAWDFHDGIAQVDSATEGHGIMDAAGKAIFSHQFSWIGDFSEGLAQVLLSDPSGKLGYINSTGTLVIPATWAF